VRTNEGRLFQTVGAQHENRRAAIFVDEDCVESRSGVGLDDLRTRDCLYGESRQVRYEVWRFCNRNTPYPRPAIIPTNCRSTNNILHVVALLGLHSLLNV